MTDIATAFKAGYSSVYALKVEGVPYLFTEKVPLRSDSTAFPTLPTGFEGSKVYDCLTIDKDSTISSDIDRKTGIGRAKGCNFRLIIDRLPFVPETSIRVGLFGGEPGTTGLLTADVAHGDTSMQVAENPSETAPYFVSVGPETWKVDSDSGTDPTTLTWSSSNRGVYGPKYTHSKDSMSTYSYYRINTLRHWRGRQVWLWEHVVDREGRMLDTQWLTGTYAREVWQGYINEPPVPIGHSIELRCNALIRRCGSPVGYTSKWNVVTSSTQTGTGDGYHVGPPFKHNPCWVSDPDQWFVISGSFTESGSTYSFYETFYDTIGAGGTTKRRMAYEGSSWHAWWSNMVLEIKNRFQNLTSADYPGTKNIVDDVEYIDVTNISLASIDWTDTLMVVLLFDPASGFTINNLTLSVPQSVVAPGHMEAGTQYNVGGLTSIYGGGSKHAVFFRWRGKYADPQMLPLLVLRHNQGQGAFDQGLITNGVGILEGRDGKKEVIRWDNMYTVDANSVTLSDTEFNGQPNDIMIRVAQRDLNGKGTAELFDVETATLVTGTSYTGELYKAMLTMLQSSGSGLRGDYDTLGVGFGLNIDDGDLELESFSSIPNGTLQVDITKEGENNFQQLFGGWLVLNNRCLTQVQTGGYVKLRAAPFSGVSPHDRDPSQTEISISDCFLEKVAPQLPLERPNQVKVTTSSFEEESPDVILRDIPRVLVEGIIGWDVSAPGMDPAMAAAKAQQIIQDGDGDGILKIDVAPWIDVQPGDKVNLKVAHPMVYDWANGSVAATQIGARVIGWGRDLATNVITLKLLVRGAFEPPQLLCPTVIITASNTGTKTITLSTSAEANPEGWFVAGEKIVLYTPGYEGTNMAEYTIATGGVNATNHTITTTALDATWATQIAAGNPVYATYPVYANASATQKLFTYNNDESTWE